MNEQEHTGEFITHLLNGNNAMIKSDYDVAVAEYALALKMNPRFFITAAKLGDAYLKKGEAAKAVKYLTYSLELNPEQPRIMYKLGQAYEDLGMKVQAAVAFEMAKEKGTGGGYTGSSSSSSSSSSSGSRRRRSQHHTSGRALADVSAADIFSRTISTFFRNPSLLLPFILAAVILSAGEKALNTAIRMITGKAAAEASISHVILTGRFEYDSAVLMHYLAIGVIISLLCAPALSAAIVMVNAIYREKKPSLADGFSMSFRQLSHIAGFSMTFLIALALANTFSAVVVASINEMLDEMAGTGISFFWVSSLALPFTASYLIYAVHSIVLEKRQMEKGLEKGFRIGKKFAGLTFVILLLYTAAHLAIASFVFNAGTSFAFLKSTDVVLLAVTPFQALTAIALTLVFLMSQHVKRKRRTSREPGKRAPEEELNEPEYDDEMEDDRE